MKTLMTPFTCPHCGETIEQCFYCDKIAEYEGWAGSSLIKLVRVCSEHAPLLRGYEKYIATFKPHPDPAPYEVTP